MENTTTDQNLHKQFVKLGNHRRKLTNALLALLPEIYERGVYKKYAATIVEYAGKFGGLSKGVVIKRLRLEKYLKDKPKLREVIKSEGLHKVALIANLATKETEDAWIDKVENMSKVSLFELAKEVRRNRANLTEETGGIANVDLDEMTMSQSTDFHSPDFCSSPAQTIKIELFGELVFMFLKLKKRYGENLSNSEIMKKIFEEVLKKDKTVKSQKIEPHQQAKKELKSFPGKTFETISVDDKKSAMMDFGKTKSRYIPVALKRSTLSKTDGKCAYPNCQKQAFVLHHTERFAESRSHQSILPFCKIHHEFAHNGLIENEKEPTENWQLNINKKGLNRIDRLYRKQRKLVQIGA